MHLCSLMNMGGFQTKKHRLEQSLRSMEPGGKCEHMSIASNHATKGGAHPCWYYHAQHWLEHLSCYFCYSSPCEMTKIATNYKLQTFQLWKHSECWLGGNDVMTDTLGNAYPSQSSTWTIHGWHTHGNCMHQIWTGWYQSVHHHTFHPITYGCRSLHVQSHSSLLHLPRCQQF